MLGFPDGNAGSEPVLMNNDGSDRVKFKITYEGNGLYRISCKAAGTGVALAADGWDNDGTLAQYSYSGTNDLMKWYFQSAEDNYRSMYPNNNYVYYIKSPYNGRYLECTGTASGQTVGQNVFTGTMAQKFLIKSSGSNIRIIPVGLEDKGLELTIGSNGNLVIAGSTNLNGGYYFTATRNANNGYKLMLISDSSKYLRLPNGASSCSSTVPVGGSYSGNILSQWVFESAGDYMESKAEYTSNGNYLTKVTGSDGKSTTYSYDTTKGNLSSVTGPGNVTTSYTYNSSNDLLTKVAQSGSSVAYTYAKRKLSSITSPNGTKYTFTYDSFNRCTKTSVGNKTLATNTYDSLGRLTVTTYGNGDKVENVYDKLSRTTSVKYDGVTKVNYTYDNDGNISKIDDKFSNIVTSFRYDSIKRPVSMKSSNGYTAEIRYDDKNRVKSTVQNIGSGDYTTTYNYNREGIITDAATEYDGERVNVWSYEWDDLYRITYRAVEVNGDEVGWQSYTYKPGTLAGSTTGLVSSYSTNGNSFSYTYDDRGNIIRVTNNGTVEATYTYDSFDRLVSETANDVTTTWTYDANGNILTRTSGGTTVNYTYSDSSWKDLLTNYNGQAITYDAIGNPTKWGNTTYSWDAGRRLMTLSKSGVSASFTYDINGYRTAKTVNGVTTTYYVDGGTITALKKRTDELIFIYDEKGMVIGFYHNGEPYVYVKNLQGDIIGIVDINYDMVVSYKYDAWGKLLSVTGELASTLGKLNPFRYRGYVYDDETGLYYLNSRYYDASVGRFINSDTSAVITASQLALTDKNLFAYCDSNPVVRIDVTGMFWDVVFDVISVCVSVKDVVSDPTNGWNWGALALDVVCLVVPVVTGGGAAVKIAKQAASHADEAADIARGVNLVQTCNAVETAADTAKAATGTSYDISKLKKTQSYTSPSAVAMYKDDILKYGANSVKPIPVIVYKGEALIVDGHHRYAAFSQLGFSRVPIKYLHKSNLGKLLPDGNQYRTLEQLIKSKVNY